MNAGPRALSMYPYSVNILANNADGISTKTFSNKVEALRFAREEVKWESTVHVTVTDDRTGEELFDEPGDFYTGE